MKPKKHDERAVALLKTLVENYWDEEKATRERQLRVWRRLKLFWDGMSRIWYSEVAHDWRAWDQQIESLGNDDGQQEYYDKPINVFRAYLESIIAALSVLVPPVEGYPDDADNPLDLQTAKAAKKIAELLYRQQNANLKWLNALFIYVTEGMVAAYNYVDEDEKYGTYEVEEYDEIVENHRYVTCSLCEVELADEVINERAKNEYDPDDSDIPLQEGLNEGMEFCPSCMQFMSPSVTYENLIVERLIGKTSKPKSRQCLDIYGGLFVKIPNYAKKQSDCPYLFLVYESHYALVRARYPWMFDKITPKSGGSSEPFERWARLNNQYRGEYPLDSVTCRIGWIRPAAFYALGTKEDVDYLLKKFPNGAKVELVNEEFADYCNENLDDHWTLTYNPLADYLQFDPPGLLLTSIQELTNDMYSLVPQTIEHGIPQTFADPAVLDFNEYGQLEASPGAIIPATPKSGKSLSDAFFDVKTATLSAEVMPFMANIQEMGQLVSGALPSLFGGDIQGSKTASQYSMSRAQALQRQQNTWKMLTSWWKDIFGKMIPAFIKEVRDDERYVEKDEAGNFINTVIRRAELEGKLGSIELEANENLPISWNQRRDAIMQLFQASNPQILEMLAQPENLPYIYEAMGLTDFYVPGLEDRNKQYEEIKLLLESGPIPQEVDPQEEETALMAGLPPPMPETSSVPVDEFDNHAVELQTCIKWINSPAGQLAKKENPQGYRNVVVHAKEHKLMLQSEMMPSPEAEGAAPNRRPKETDKEAPIMGEGDVKTNQ